MVDKTTVLQNGTTILQNGRPFCITVDRYAERMVAACPRPEFRKMFFEIWGGAAASEISRNKGGGGEMRRRQQISDKISLSVSVGLAPRKKNEALTRTPTCHFWDCPSSSSLLPSQPTQQDRLDRREQASSPRRARIHRPGARASLVAHTLLPHACMG